jgi:hypothetical protein
MKELVEASTPQEAIQKTTYKNNQLVRIIGTRCEYVGRWEGETFYQIWYEVGIPKDERVEKSIPPDSNLEPNSYTVERTKAGPAEEIPKQFSGTGLFGRILSLNLNDPNPKLAHAAWLAANLFAKEIWPSEQHRQLSEQIKQLLIVIQEEQPPLKKEIK